MEVVSGSWFCRLFAPAWLWLRDKYEYSLLAAFLRGLASGWRRWCSGSVVMRFLTREGILSRFWKDSVFCRIITAIINIPSALLYRLYRNHELVFEHSAASRIGFAIAEQTPLAVGWLMLLVMVIPFKYWNNAYALAGFILCTILAIASGMRHREQRLDVASVGPWLTAFAGAVACAWPLSSYVSQSGRFLLYHITCILCVVVIVSTVWEKQQLVRLMTMSSLALIVMSLSGFYQRAIGVMPNPSYVDMNLNKGMPGRVYAFYENPNSFGEVLLLLIPLAVALMLCSETWRGRFLGLVSTGLGCMAMAMTYSRAGWVGLAFAAFLFILLWKRKLIPACILLGFVALSFLPDTVFRRILTIFNTSDTSTTSRFPLYQAAGEFLQQRPVLGAGLGSDAVRSAINDTNLFHGKDNFVHCHNIYLQVWCETGLLGIVSFVGGILWTFKKGAKAVAQATCGPQVRLAIIGGVTALMGSMLCGIADYIWNYPRVMLIFWFVCAIALAGIRLAAREAEEHQS